MSASMLPLRRRAGGAIATTENTAALGPLLTLRPYSILGISHSFSLYLEIDGVH